MLSDIQLFKNHHPRRYPNHLTRHSELAERISLAALFAAGAPHSSYFRVQVAFVEAAVQWLNLAEGRGSLVFFEPHPGERAWHLE